MQIIKDLTYLGHVLRNSKYKNKYNSSLSKFKSKPNKNNVHDTEFYDLYVTYEDGNFTLPDKLEESVYSENDSYYYHNNDMGNNFSRSRYYIGDMSTQKLKINSESNSYYGLVQMLRDEKYLSLYEDEFIISYLSALKLKFNDYLEQMDVDLSVEEKDRKKFHISLYINGVRWYDYENIPESFLYHKARNKSTLIDGKYYYQIPEFNFLSFTHYQNPDTVFCDKPKELKELKYKSIVFDSIEDIVDFLYSLNYFNQKTQILTYEYTRSIIPITDKLSAKDYDRFYDFQYSEKHLSDKVDELIKYCDDNEKLFSSIEFLTIYSKEEGDIVRDILVERTLGLSQFSFAMKQLNSNRRKIKNILKLSDTKMKMTYRDMINMIFNDKSVDKLKVDKYLSKKLEIILSYLNNKYIESIDYIGLLNKHFEYLSRRRFSTGNSSKSYNVKSLLASYLYMKGFHSQYDIDKIQDDKYYIVGKKLAYAVNDLDHVKRDIFVTLYHFSKNIKEGKDLMLFANKVDAINLNVSYSEKLGELFYFSFWQHLNYIKLFNK